MTEEEKTKIREFLKGYKQSAGVPLVIGKYMIKILRENGISEDYIGYPSR